MRAILYAKKGFVSIYTLEDGDGDRSTNMVSELLSSIAPAAAKVKKDKRNARGFVQLLNRILDGEWNFLTEDFKKSWPVNGEDFCELIKGDYRLGCFMEQTGSIQRLLLVSWFKKHGDKEKKEYNKAVAQYRRFLREEPQTWDDREGKDE